MLNLDQLTQLETRLLERLRGEDGDLAVLLAHVAQLTTHNRVMQVALAQFANGDNWRTAKRYNDVQIIWNGGDYPQQLAERALVGDGGLSTQPTIDI